MIRTHALFIVALALVQMGLLAWAVNERANARRMAAALADARQLRGALASPVPGPAAPPAAPATSPAADGYVLTDPRAYIVAVDLIHILESRGGRAVTIGDTGPAGERGEFQITPVCAADLERITGVPCDPLDVDRCRWQCLAYLLHYGPALGCQRPEELAELWRRGPAGYRRWAATAISKGN